MTGLSSARCSVRAMEEAQDETFTGALFARGKRLAIIGAALLWIASPLLIGAWVTMAVKLADRGDVGVGLYAVMVVWALVCLVVLLAGFAMLLGGVFFWWRSRVVTDGRAQARTSARGRGGATNTARAQMLRQVQQQLRDERPVDDEPGSDHRDVVGHGTGARRLDEGAGDDVVEDSEAPRPRR